jgi:hypothetical protein
MKILYFIVSINLTAATTVGAQLAACADNEAVSEKANWLKASLSSLESMDSAAQPKLVGQKAVAQSLDRIASKSSSKSIILATHTGTVKLMPFVPNRKLPSKRDLETTLIPQTAQMAPEQNKPLAGQVALFDGSNHAESNYVVPKSAITSLNKLATKKTWNNLLAATKATYSVAKNSGAGFPFLKQAEHQLLEQTSETASQPVNEQPVSAQPSANLDQQMIDAYKEMQLSERNSQLNHSGQINSQSTAQSGVMMNDQISAQAGINATSAGPAPFPLSLLPQASLKQLMRGMASRSSARGPATYFGCWHNSGGLATGGFQHYSQAGRTYSQFGQRATGGFRVPQRASFAPQISRGRTSSNQRLAQIRKQAANRAIAVARLYTPPRVMQVASYAAYPTVRQFGVY